MVSFPHCKINLGLRVISKREDGYHAIDTCFYPVPWNDILEIIPAKIMSFTNTGIEVPGAPDKNLCLRSYYLLKEDFDLQPVGMHLHKVVPMGAGLGGGSSDGAFALKILNSIFELRLTNDELKSYASRLGSDCAFFIEDKPMIGSSRGDILAPIELSLKGKFLVIVKPPIHVSTADAYKNCKPAQPDTDIAHILLNRKLEQWSEILINDFEKSVFAQYPLIGEIKNKLYELGATYACMSGSGSSVFGIFDAALNGRIQFPNCDYWSGEL